MVMTDIILKKRNGEALTREEIHYFVQGYTEGSIPDYQAAALLMAIYFQKMNEAETAYLTEAMMNSGSIVDLSKIEGIKVDKHSTGGVGDKTTIALGAMVAACGVPVAKMSGRGLGHTGGTIDKLESIPGFSVEMEIIQFIQNVNEIKLAVVGQTQDLAPADKKLYALRDVTGTVDNLSLIASSIMSKKLAAGADAILLDVKTGSGAFMKTLEDSYSLAQEMVKIGYRMNRDTIGIVTDMDQPLGSAIGNCLEVMEAVDTLRGHGPKDFTKLCIYLGAYMLLLAKKVSSVEAGVEKMQSAIDTGEALKALKTFVKRQGGDCSFIEDPQLLPQAKFNCHVIAEKAGFIQSIDAQLVGLSALSLGAGRATKESTIDLTVGIRLHKKTSDLVQKGEALATIYYNDEGKKEEALKKLFNAYKIADEKPQTRPLIFGVVTKDGITQLNLS